MTLVVLCQGKKDFVSVKQEGTRVHIQKRLVLSNLREVYGAFKDTYPDKKIGFSKFAELRPQHCILALVYHTPKYKVGALGS
jgi:hypothetical protein